MIQFLIDRFKLIVVDGALATELEQRGCNLNDPLWSARVLIEQPELISQIHEDYFRAGADVAITASYQASIPGFMARGLSAEQAAHLIYRSVSLAARARERFLAAEPDLERRPKPMIAGSVGSYGAFLADGSEFTGAFSQDLDQLIAFHRPRMEILCNRNQADSVDFLAFETIPCLAEAKALVALLGEFPQMSAWMSFSARDGEHLSSGEPISAAASFLADQPQILALGLNCTSPRYIASLAARIQQVSDKPIVAYPNSGEIFLPQSHSWDPATVCERSRSMYEEWYRQGVRMVGGCCRTGPADIHEIASWRLELQDRH